MRNESIFHDDLFYKAVENGVRLVIWFGFDVRVNLSNGRYVVKISPTDERGEPVCPVDNYSIIRSLAFETIDAATNYLGEKLGTNGHKETWNEFVRIVMREAQKEIDLLNSFLRHDLAQPLLEEMCKLFYSSDFNAVTPNDVYEGVVFWLFGPVPGFYKGVKHQPDPECDRRFAYLAAARSKGHIHASDPAANVIREEYRKLRATRG